MSSPPHDIRHPATTWNQKKIWEAEQKDAKDKKDEAAANKELKRDSDRRFYEHLAGGKEQDPSSTALNFMYAPPPGFQQVKASILRTVLINSVTDSSSSVSAVSSVPGIYRVQDTQ